MRPFLYFLWMTLAFASLMGCESDGDLVTVDTGSSYYPIKKGLFQIYDVERTEYVLGNPTTTTYQLKTVVVDSFLNAQNTYTYIQYRSLRYDEADEWQYLDSWSVRPNAAETVLMVENLPVVSLIFPVKPALKWDANVYNTLTKHFFTIESLNSPAVIGDNTFEDCLTVKQADNDDYVVFLDQRKEVYARNIGLVYKDSTALQYCTQNSCLGLQQIEQGVIYRQTIRSYGVE